MSDLTVMYITACRMPQGWRAFHLEHLRESTKDHEVLVSARELPVGIGFPIQQVGEWCYGTIYDEMLKLAKLATTPYVAMAEDDVLYTPEHFREFRPPLDAVVYNRARWTLYTWNPVFHLKSRLSNAALIAGREYLIDSLEERLNKHPAGVPSDKVGEIGRPRVERRLNVSARKALEFWSSKPIIHLHHPAGVDSGDKPGWRKTYGQIQAYDIPYWGKASDLVARFTAAD